MRSLFNSPKASASVLAVIALLSTTPCAAQQSGRTYPVLGRVVDSLANPITDADISISTVQLSARTDAYGEFHLDHVPAGTFVILVRKVGFGPVNVQIQMPRDTSLEPVTLSAGAVTLRTVVTEAEGLYGKPARLSYTTKFDEFYERRQGSAAGGRFYTREDVDRMHVMSLLDALRRVPHMQIWEADGHVMFRFPRCSMKGTMIKWNGNQIWPSARMAAQGSSAGNLPSMNDDTLAQGDVGPFDLDRDMSSTRIEGIEVYPLPSSLPVEAVGNACAAIFLWTQ